MTPTRPVTTEREFERRLNDLVAEATDHGVGVAGHWAVVTASTDLYRVVFTPLGRGPN